MGTVARIKKDGSFLTSGEINERLPVITNGLIAYYPLDNNTNQSMPSIPSTAKVLAYRQNTDPGYNAIYTWFNTHTTLTDCSDLTAISIDTAKQYDLIIADCSVWSVSNAIIDKMKTFVDSGISCIASGNDTRTNTFVLSYNDAAYGTHDVKILNNLVGLTNLVYVNAGNGDIGGGISSLASNCIPYYQRTDANLITGYFYISPITKAVLYFDQEGYISPTIDVFMAGMLYAYNNSIGRTVNNNTIISNNGLAVQDGTTNLVTSYTKAFNNWAGLTGSTSYFMAPNGHQGIVLMAGNSGGVQWTGTNNFPVSSGTVYTVSCKVKATNWNTVSANLFYIRQYNPTGQTSEGGIYTNTNKIKLDNGFYYTWASFTTASNVTSVTIQSYQYSPGMIWVYDLQVQRLNYPLEYVGLNTTTSNSNLKIPLSISSFPFTVSVNIRNLMHNGQNGEFGEVGVGYPISWWTTSGGYKGVLGQFGRTTSAFQKDTFRATLICRATTYTLYFDDTIVYDGIYYNNTVSPFSTPISLGTRNYEEDNGRFNGIYSDCAIYNRELSIAEIKKLITDELKLTSNYAIMNKMVESPSVLDEGFYFPLSTDTKDIYKTVDASIKDNVLFEDSSVWVGTSTTNLIPQTGNYTVVGLGTVPMIINSSNLVIYSHDYNENVSGGAYHGYDLTIANGSTYTYSMDAVVTKDFNYTGSTFFIANCEQGFDAWYYYNMSDLGKWKRFTTTSNSTSTNARTLLYPNNGFSIIGKIYYKNWMLCNKSYRPCFCIGTSGNVNLAYNFNQSIGLNWAGDWSICYWKKPVATHTDNLAGFNIESLGCNGNSVGGGYIWYGKVNGSNSILGSGSFSPSDYFNKWQFISMVKTGTNIVIKTILDNGTVYIVNAGTTNTVSNYYVTQYGYDFKLGGWDNGGSTNTYFRDLIVVKRALTDFEVTNVYKQFSVTKYNTFTQNLIEQGI